MDGDSGAFELNIAVEPDDIDQFGHVNNIVYLRWVQDAAAAHWTAIAPASDREKLQWVIVRHEIDYKQAAFLGDEIIARTWVGNARRIRFERHTEILRARDRAILAKAVTLWCPIDTGTGKITLVSPEAKGAVFSTALRSELHGLSIFRRSPGRSRALEQPSGQPET